MTDRVTAPPNSVLHRRTAGTSRPRTQELLGKGFSYAEVPIRYRWRDTGRSFVKVGRYLLHVLPATARSAFTR